MESSLLSAGASSPSAVSRETRLVFLGPARVGPAQRGTLISCQMVPRTSAQTASAGPQAQIWPSIAAQTTSWLWVEAMATQVGMVLVAVSPLDTTKASGFYVSFGVKTSVGLQHRPQSQ